VVGRVQGASSLDEVAILGGTEADDGALLELGGALHFRLIDIDTVGGTLILHEPVATPVRWAHKGMPGVGGERTIWCPSSQGRNGTCGWQAEVSQCNARGASHVMGESRVVPWAKSHSFDDWTRNVTSGHGGGWHPETAFEENTWSQRLGSRPSLFCLPVR
jgi:hypothetical protein